MTQGCERVVPLDCRAIREQRRALAIDSNQYIVASGPPGATAANPELIRLNRAQDCLRRLTTSYPSRGFRHCLVALLVFAVASMSVGGRVAAQEQLLTGELGYVRFVHASLTGGASLNFLADGELLVQDLGFGSATDIFVSLWTGPHAVAVAVSEGGSQTILAEATIEVAQGVAYEVAAVGTTSATAIEFYPIEGVASAENRAGVRLINCVPDAEVASLAGFGDGQAIEGVSYSLASNYIEVDAGVHNLTLTVTGGGQESMTVPLGEIALDGGVMYDIFVTGLVADASLSFILVGP
jgi:Domain of unknown function (DUF4397)